VNGVDPELAPMERGLPATTRAGETGVQFVLKGAEALVLRAASVGLLLSLHVLVARDIGPDQFGWFTWVLSLASLGGLVGSLGIPIGVLRFVSQYQEQERWGELRGLLRVTPVIVIASCVVIGVATIGIGWSIPTVAHERLLGLGVAALLIPLLGFGQWRARAALGFGKLRLSLVPEEIALPILVIVAVLVLPVENAARALLVYVTAAAIASVSGTAMLRRVVPVEVREARELVALKEWLVVSLPMILAASLQLTMNRSDVLLLGLLVDMETTGIYGAASRLALLTTFALRAVDVVVAPMLSASYHGNRIGDLRRTFRRGQMWATVGAVPLLAISIAAPAELLRLFGPGFEAGTAYLRILAVGQFINAITGPAGFALLMTGHERLFAGILGGFTAAAVVANVAAISIWGGIGAAVATATSIGVMKVTMLLTVRRRVLGRRATSSV
jgi:O-antigen/teichoic acid export membrane protein